LGLVPTFEPTYAQNKPATLQSAVELVAELTEELIQSKGRGYLMGDLKEGLIVVSQAIL
jgi:hypothetical protein